MMEVNLRQCFGSCDYTRVRDEVRKGYSLIVFSRNGKRKFVCVMGVISIENNVIFQKL